MAKKDRLVSVLVAAFGSASVRVNTEYHVQVRSGDSWHNIYLNQRGDISLRLRGKRSGVVVHSPKDIVSRINTFQESKTELAAMNEALKLGESIQHAHRVLVDRQIDAAIFVDGGWKDGKAKIAAILVRSDGDADISVRSIECDSSSNTEIRAVLLGYELRSRDEDVEIPIFTDCQAVLGHTLVSHVDNLHWVPRNRNKGADRLSNMRQKHMVTVNGSHSTTT